MGVEIPIMEEAPAWLEEEPEQQQNLEEQLEDIMDSDVLASEQPSTLTDTPTPTHTSRRPLLDSWPSVVRGKHDKHPIIFSRKRW
jgi:hypothetical protein